MTRPSSSSIKSAAILRTGPASDRTRAGVNHCINARRLAACSSASTDRRRHSLRMRRRPQRRQTVVLRGRLFCARAGGAAAAAPPSSSCLPPPRSARSAPPLSALLLPPSSPRWRAGLRSLSRCRPLTACRLLYPSFSAHTSQQQSRCSSRVVTAPPVTALPSLPVHHCPPPASRHPINRRLFQKARTYTHQLLFFATRRVTAAGGSSSAER